MWIDYQKSKKAVERNLYTCRDYIMMGYFSLDSELNVQASFEKRFGSSSGSYLPINTHSKSAGMNLLTRLADQDDQYIWFADIISALKKLDKSLLKVIFYHYLKGFSLNALKLGVIDGDKEIRISKAYEKNKTALLKLMILFDDCLIPYTGPLDKNRLILKHKCGAINFVIEKRDKK